MTNARLAARRFAKNPQDVHFVARNLKAEGMSDEDVLTGLCRAAFPAHLANDSTAVAA